MADGTRRSAREWSRLVREWKRSGVGRAEFAARYGVAAATLSWWRWRLERERGATAERSEVSTSSIKLVRVEVQDESAAEDAPARVAWELVAPSGHTLRVYGDGNVETLRAAIELLVRGDGER